MPPEDPGKVLVRSEARSQRDIQNRVAWRSEQRLGMLYPAVQQELVWGLA
jgi:hypothetical protein